MNSSGILHMTVDAMGHVRVFDSPRELLAQKAAGDVQIALPLTRSQIAMVLKAEAVAKVKQMGAADRMALAEHAEYVKNPTDPRD